MRPNAAFLWPGYSLSVDRPVEVVDTWAETADERWTFVDEQGHGHFWKDGYPTLVVVVEPCYCEDHDDDCIAGSHYECPICGEVIRPGTRPSDPIRIEGPTTYELTADGRTWRFGPEQWTALDTAVKRAIADTLSDEHLVEVTFGRSA